MRLLRNLTIALLAAAAVAGWIAARRPRPASGFADKRIAFLETENRRLTDLLAARQRADDLLAARAQRGEIEVAIAKLRDLDFKRPVTYREIGREDLPAILRQKLLQQVPEKEFADSGVAMAALGLLPQGLDLEKTYLALLGEQIGAFYDQHTQELYTFSGHPLTNAANRVVMAHELTHALQDQHFNLRRLPLETKNNDDRALAASALVEGDATLAMNQYTLGDLSAASLKDSLAQALTTDVRQLVAAPKFLRETLLFPYLGGLNFCQTLYETGGWAALNEAYANPPASTAQILHPEKFLAESREDPIEIDMGDPVVLGQKPLVSNVLGEFGARQMFNAWLHDEARAAAAAAGWRGDRYLVYGDAKANSWVWTVACADKEAAKSFEGALTKTLYSRYNVHHSKAMEPVPFKSLPPGATERDDRAEEARFAAKVQGGLDAPATLTLSEAPKPSPPPAPLPGVSQSSQMGLTTYRDPAGMPRLIEATFARAGEVELKTCVTRANEVIVIDAQDARWSTALAEQFAPGIHFPE